MAGVSLQAQQANAALANKAADNLAKVLGGIGVGGKHGLADVGVEVTNRVKANLSKPGTGRTYRRGSVLHRASTPGSPPAVDTGRLRASYTWRLGRDARGDYVEVGTNVEYAPMLEFGTRYMMPRPHLRPAINSLRTQITQLVRDGIITEQRNIIRRLPKEIAA